MLQYKHGGDNVAKKQRGDPVMTLRMPRAVITALQIEAAKRETTVSKMLRDLAMTELESKGYRFTEKPLEGQMMLE